MRLVGSFLRFIWHFVIGDDWRIALSVVCGILLTLVLSDNGVRSWWLLPLVVAVTLGASVLAAARNR